MNKYSEAYRVAIRHNLVIRMGQVADGEPELNNLSAGARLATAYRENGCIDGDYDFNNIHVAKDFAVLSLDFVKKLVSQNLENLEKHNFFSEPTWENPLVSGE